MYALTKAGCPILKKKKKEFGKRNDRNNSE
jgi:hypothetical protein